MANSADRAEFSKKVQDLEVILDVRDVTEIRCGIRGNVKFIHGTQDLTAAGSGIGRILWMGCSYIGERGIMSTSDDTRECGIRTPTTTTTSRP